MIIQSSSVYTQRAAALQWSWSCFIFSIACVRPERPFLISQRIPNAVIPSAQMNRLIHRGEGFSAASAAGSKGFLSLCIHYLNKDNLSDGVHGPAGHVPHTAFEKRVQRWTVHQKHVCDLQKAAEHQAKMTLWNMSCCLSQAFIISEESCSVMKECKPCCGTAPIIT